MDSLSYAAMVYVEIGAASLLFSLVYLVVAQDKGFREASIIQADQMRLPLLWAKNTPLVVVWVALVLAWPMGVLGWLFR
jgi:hypothetical protein